MDILLPALGIFLMYFGIPTVIIFTVYLIALLLDWLAEQWEHGKGVRQNENGKPLLILRYSPLHIAWYAVFPFLIMSLLLSAICFNTTGKEKILVLTFCILVWVFTFYVYFDMFLTQDIKLYRDKIVKRYKFGIKKDIVISLDMAIFSLIRLPAFPYSYILTIHDESLRQLSLFHRIMSRLLHRVILINETLLKFQDRRRLHETLSQISSRNIEEMQNTSFKIHRKVSAKEGARHESETL